MIKVENNRKVCVYGICFSGVDELKRVALSKQSKGGVYVRARMESYPCFDSSDYAYEDRCYTHFVFGHSKEEVEYRLGILCGRGGRLADWSAELGPVIYWAGDTHHPMEFMECDDIVVERQ